MEEEPAHEAQEPEVEEEPALAVEEHEVEEEHPPIPEEISTAAPPRPQLCKRISAFHLQARKAKITITYFTL